MADVTNIKNGIIEASVDALGAQLMSLKRDGVEYLWQGDPAWWPRRAPVLFPIVGNIRGDRADSAQGEVRLGRHGLARNYVHEVVGSGEDFVTYSLESSDETRAKFPFDFRLSMTYRLGDGGLEQRFAVTNTGDVTLPYVVGGHPAFNVPVAGNPEEDFSDYELRFSRPWSVTSPTIEDGIWNMDKRFTLLEDSDTLRLSHRLFDVDTLMFEDVPDRTVRLVGPAGHGVELDFDGFDYLGVWSAANGAPFVAIEPWRGCATCSDEDDTFEHKRGMDFLEPGESSEYSFTIRPF